MIAIIGIIAAMGLASLGAMARRGTVRTATSELAAAFAEARSTAATRNSDVWLIVYPTIDKAGAAGGSGAYFIYVDPDLSFGSAGAPPSGEIRFSTFDPAGGESAMVPTAGRGQLQSRVYLDDYSQQSVHFVSPQALSLTLRAPYTALNPVASACGFCTNSPPRGALVFEPEGRVRFVDGDGVEVGRSTATAAGRSTWLSMGAKNGTEGTAYVIAGPTGFVSVFAK